MGIFREYWNKCFWRTKCFGKGTSSVYSIADIKREGRSSDYAISEIKREMPFSPSVLHEVRHTYICFEHGNACSIAFHTTMHSSRMHTARSSSLLLRGVCLSACWDTHTPRCGLGDTPGCGSGDPRCGPGDGPGCGPRDPPGVGLETCPGQTHQPPPWVWAWRPARHAGIPPPYEQNDWQTRVKTKPSQTSFACDKY